MTVPGPQVERQAVREQLNKILTSSEFLHSNSSKRLLDFLVDHYLGDSPPDHKLKEYVVGVEVFGKTADFDTRSSSIVRVEATRLRQKLRRYYESDGIHDRVHISLPRGGYSPRVELREPGVTERNRKGTSGVQFPVNSLAILPPENSGVSTERAGLLLATIWRSLHLAGMELYPLPALPARRGQRRRRTRENPAFRLELRIEAVERATTVSASLKTADSQIVWQASDSAVSDLERYGCRISHDILKCLHLSPPASRWYGMGRHLIGQFTPVALWTSRICFENAILQDHGDARAHEALALSCALLYLFDGAEPELLVQRIRESAARGLSPSCGPHVYLSLAVIAWGYERNWKEAERLLNVARDLYPDDPTVRYWRALCLASAGRNQGAAEELLQSYDSRAFSVAAELALGCALWLQQHPGQAASRIRRAIAAEPKNALAHLLLGWILLADSRPSEALEPLETAQALFGTRSPATGALGYALAKTGRGGVARDLLEKQRYGADSSAQVHAETGIIHLGLGEGEQARVCLRTAWEKHSGRLSLLNFSPEFESIRTNWLTALFTNSLTSVA
jgi:tetratricopeptide (TPR) repeat protein